MEIQELIFFYHHENSNTVEVQFRLNIDSEDEIRIDQINLKEAADFGYDLIVEDVESYGDDEEYNSYWFDESTIDEDNLISFLNEYYIIYPEKLPKSEII